MSAEEPQSPATLPQVFLETVARLPEKEALLVREGKTFSPLSFTEYALRVRHLALALAEAGVKAGDRVCILSENCPEWVIADMAVLSLGAVVVPIYPTLPPAQVEYIVRDAGAGTIFVSDKGQLAKVQAVRDRLPGLERVIVIQPPDELPDGVTTFAAVLDSGTGVADGEERYQRAVEGVQPEDMASIVYTSGTTGEPKGAMLSHRNFTFDVAMTLQRVEVRPDDVILSYIPLSHIFSRIVNYCAVFTGATTAFAQSIFTVAASLQAVRPTLLPTVPRLLESIQSRAMAAAAKGGAPGDLRESLGGRLRAIISGGGPLSVETGTFFQKFGLVIVEGYGLTEIAGVGAAHPPQRPKLGTIGPPLDGVEAKIAEDGEILMRGPNVMLGYHNKEAETRAAIDAEGWFHTGDIGEFDDDGYLVITDRKKDLIVLSNGKKVAPQAIERALKASRFILEVALFGDRQPNLSALIVPDAEQVKVWGKEQGLELADGAAIAASPEVKKLIKTEIDAHSGDLADFEKVRRFAVLEREFSMQHDELTPTLKLKRRVIAANFEGVIRGLQGGGDGG